MNGERGQSDYITQIFCEKAEGVLLWGPHNNDQTKWTGMQPSVQWLETLGARGLGDPYMRSIVTVTEVQSSLVPLCPYVVGGGPTQDLHMCL